MVPGALSTVFAQLLAIHHADGIATAIVQGDGEDIERNRIPHERGQLSRTPGKVEP